jgi:putative spermidine/putrescine transport system permease protein
MDAGVGSPRNPGIAAQAVTLGLLAPALLLLGGWFLVPLGQLFALSLDSPHGMFAAYQQLLDSNSFLAAFGKTIQIAVVVTVVCVALAYPTAYFLMRLHGLRRQVALYCILVPFWISALVRCFGWMLLLGRTGPINHLLLASGLVGAPLPLLFNDFAVYVATTHVLLPYALLPIYASMRRLDQRLVRASEGLGAPPLTTLLRVYLPLTLPGVLAGATIVLLLSLGFFITPALLGGLKVITATMLIDSYVNEQLVWPLAAAASFMLLAVILGLLAVGARFASLGGALIAR